MKKFFKSYWAWRSQPAEIVEAGSPTSSGDKIGLIIVFILAGIFAYARFNLMM